MLHYPKCPAEWLALRHRHVSSTEVAALFGLSPYLTAFELATIKKQDVPPDDLETNERAEWGLCLQDAIARRIAVRYGVRVRAINAYATHSYEHCRMGASFDYEIVGVSNDDAQFSGDAILREMYLRHGAGILEIKNVDALVFRDRWVRDEDGGIEAPAHIEIQVQHQLACISRFWAAVGVLVGGNRLELLIRERDDDVHKALRIKCESFWDDLRRGVMPPVDLPADAAVVAKLYRYAEPGKVLDAQGDVELAALCAEYAEAAKAESAAKAAKETAKAKLLMRIGDAEKVLTKGYTVSAGVVAETEVPAYTRKAYRNVRVTAEKAKKETSHE